jgi:ABC-2 type transport system permease protein
MAVYKKSYRPYEGPLTPGWSRFLILSRYSFEEMRQKRFFGLFLMGAMIWPIICALTIYLNHNLSTLKILGLEPEKLIAIDARFFLFYLGLQSQLAFFLTAFVGPGLVSPDLANNALPLYLSRPFTRSEYVLGRISVLLVLLSVFTWVPGLLLFALQSYLEGATWFAGNLRIAGALFAGSWIWILILSLLALAFSAWVKWKPLAGALLFITLFVGAGFANATNQILDTRWGHVVNLTHLIGTVWLNLFGEPNRLGAGAVFFRVQPGAEMPLWTAWAALFGFCAVCLHLLSKRIRGMEIVR